MLVRRLRLATAVSNAPVRPARVPRLRDLPDRPDARARRGRRPRVLCGLLRRRRAPRRGLASPRSRFWNMARRVPALAAPAQLAVDVGCGDGHLCAQLHEAGWLRVVGIDVSATRLAGARRRYPHLTFLNGPLAGAGLQPGSADLVVLDNVIEHLPDPVAVLRQVAGCLAPGGRCALITPNMESGSFRLLGRRWTPGAGAARARLPVSCAVDGPRDGKSRPVTRHARQLPAHPIFARSVAALLGDRPISSMRCGRPVQELGGLYGRLLGAGAMLYAVGVPAQ